MSTLSKAYQNAYDKIQDEVEKAIKESGQKIELKYAAYDWDDADIPLNNLKEVPVKGKVKFVDQGEWTSNYKPFESDICDSPTWLEIAVIANKMVTVTGDKHHVFLESLGDYEVDDNGVKLVIIGMGS